jgi:hypothetical protein
LTQYYKKSIVTAVVDAAAATRKRGGHEGGDDDEVPAASPVPAAVQFGGLTFGDGKTFALPEIKRRRKWH